MSPPRFWFIMTRAAAVDKRYAASQRPGRRTAPQLGFLQGPVLDTEFLFLGNRLVHRQGLRPTHDVDGVDVELTGDPGRGRVDAEAPHADAGDEDDGGIGA